MSDTVIKTNPVDQLPLIRPAVDLFERDDALLLVADLPGANDSTIELTLDGNALELVATAIAHEPAGKRTIGDQGGRRYARRFELGEQVMLDSISAQCRDGVLTITLPIMPPTQPRRIEIVTN